MRWLVLDVLIAGIGPHGSRLEGPALRTEPGRVAKSPEAQGDTLRAAFLAAQQAHAGDAYRVLVEPGVGTLNEGVLQRAFNPAEQAQVEFMADGVRIAPKKDGARAAPSSVGLRLTRLGREGALLPAPPADPPASTGNRVEYRRANVMEWYVNGPLGLEQGFTVHERPAGTGPFILELAVGDGLRPILSGDRQSVELRGSAGLTVGRYSELHVQDAGGRSVEAALAVAADAITLTVSDQGAAYPIVVDPMVTSIPVPNGASVFGSSVAVDGDTAVIGAPNTNSVSGAAYVFVRNTDGTWSEQQELFASDGGGQFGMSVAVSGDAIIVGAPANSGNAGAAYLFVRTGVTWSPLLPILRASDFTAGDTFGNSVALTNNVALVGAPHETSHHGAAYLFTSSTTPWSSSSTTSQQKLITSNGQLGFGNSVALRGNTALIGAPFLGNGAAFIFTNSGGSQWSQSQPPLLAADGAQGDLFGYSVALSDNTALIGAFGANNSAGAAYLFSNSGGLWAQQQPKLVASDGTASDAFGRAIALVRDVALIGADNKQTPGVGSRLTGAAYEFVHREGTWSQLPAFVAQDTTNGDRFGGSVALSSQGTGVTGLVGAPGKSPAGAAYAFFDRPIAVPALGNKVLLMALVLIVVGFGWLAHDRRARATA
jgi:hypothetical protein